MIRTFQRLPTALAVLLALLAAQPAAGAGVHVSFVPIPAIVSPGDTFTVELTVTPADAEFNAFDFVISYDTARLVFVPTTPSTNQRGPLMTAACANSFHIFTPTAGALQVTYSLLCNNTFVTGPGVIYRVKFAATMTTGNTTISCGAGTQFYRAGFFVNPLDCTTLTLDVGGTSGVGEPDGRIAERPWLAPLSPNPRIGSATPGRVSFQLPGADSVRLALFDARGRLVTERPSARYAAGAHTVDWRLPRLAAGTYYLRLSTGSGHDVTQRWVLIN